MAFVEYFFEVIEPTIDHFEMQKSINQSSEIKITNDSIMAPIVKIAERFADYYKYNLGSDGNGYLTEQTEEEYELFNRLPLNYFGRRDQNMSDFCLYFRDQMFSPRPTPDLNASYLEILKTINLLKKHYQLAEVK